MFWEKDWGTISEVSYQLHLVPVIDGWIRLCSLIFGEDLILMQDNAPGHAVKSTIEDFIERGVKLIV